MKKLFFTVAIAGFTFACNDGSKSATSTTDSAAATSATTPAAADSSAAATQSSLKDSLMTMKDGKMMIVKNGAWAAMSAPITCTNGRMVSIDGVVSKKDKKRKLEEGMMIDKDGQIMDKNGKLMDTSGWD